MFALRWLLIVLLLVAGCKTRDDETLRKIVRKTGEKLHSVTAPIQATTTGMRGSLGEGSIPARVEARMRWDRYLHEQPIVVRCTGRNHVILSGTVTEASVKQRAVDLAKSTLGVGEVEDKIIIASQ